MRAIEGAGRRSGRAGLHELFGGEAVEARFLQLKTQSAEAIKLLAGIGESLAGRLLLFDAPDSQTATSAMLYLAAQGNVTTQTAEIFSAAGVEKILKEIGKL